MIQELYSHLDTKKINPGRALKRLTGTGILLHKNKSYNLSDPLFELWIKEKIINN